MAFIMRKKSFNIIFTIFTLCVLTGCSQSAQEGLTDTAIPAFVPSLNPNATITPLEFANENPELPAFLSWEYRDTSESVIDIESLIGRIWNGQEYESLGFSDGTGYRLTLYGSRYGRFRESIDPLPNGFYYRWEINENYPKERNGAYDVQNPVTLKIEHEKAIAFVSDFLDTEEFVQYNAPFSYTLDEDNTPISRFLEFNWLHLIDSKIPVHGDGVYMRVIPEGVPALSFRWTTLEAVGNMPPREPLTFKEALYSLNYIRSFMPFHEVEDETIISARVVYTNKFMDDQTLFRPSWEFTISREGKEWYTSTTLIDCLTGDMYNAHDGIVKSFQRN